MRRYFSLLVVMILISASPSVCLAFGGPAPELNEGMPGSQAAPATVETVAPVPVPPPAIAPTPEVKTAPVVAPAPVVPKTVMTGTELYKVRVGLFSKKEPAVSLMNKLKAEGRTAFLVTQSGLWRVQVGAFRDRARAEEVATELKARSYPVDIVVTE